FASLAHAAYAQWDTEPPPDWLSHWERELSNLRVAIGWSLDDAKDLELGAGLVADASPLFLRLSLLGEAIAFGERVVAAHPALTAGVEARLHYSLSMLYNNQG